MREFWNNCNWHKVTQQAACGRMRNETWLSKTESSALSHFTTLVLTNSVWTELKCLKKIQILPESNIFLDLRSTGDTVRQKGMVQLILIPLPRLWSHHQDQVPFYLLPFWAQSGGNTEEQKQLLFTLPTEIPDGRRQQKLGRRAVVTAVTIPLDGSRSLSSWMRLKKRRKEASLLPVIVLFLSDFWTTLSQCCYLPWVCLQGTARYKS